MWIESNLNWMDRQQALECHWSISSIYGLMVTYRNREKIQMTKKRQTWNSKSYYLWSALFLWHLIKSAEFYTYNLYKEGRCKPWSITNEKCCHVTAFFLPWLIPYFRWPSSISQEQFGHIPIVTCYLLKGPF